MFKSYQVSLCLVSVTTTVPAYSVARDKKNIKNDTSRLLALSEDGSAMLGGGGPVTLTTSEAADLAR